MKKSEALDILGLSDGATDDAVKQAHRKLVIAHHPDKFPLGSKEREDAEEFTKRINEARDVLLKGGGRASHSGARPRGGARSGSGRGGAASANSPEQIRLEAEARVRAAETARLTVVAQARTMRERRRSMGMLAGGAAIVMLLCSRMRGTIGMLAFSVASMLVVWGIVDVVSLSGQISVLQKRSAELLRQRDAAAKIAEEAARL